MEGRRLTNYTLPSPSREHEPTSDCLVDRRFYVRGACLFDAGQDADKVLVVGTSTGGGGHAGERESGRVKGREGQGEGEGERKTCGKWWSRKSGAFGFPLVEPRDSRPSAGKVLQGPD
jgi:hypothetical protein